MLTGPLAPLLKPGRPFFLALFAVALMAFVLVLTGQYAFGLRPCELCTLERIPYALVGLVSAAMVLLPTSARLRRLAAGLVTLAFAAGAGLSAYHIGVEQHWWASAVCTATGPLKVNFADLQAALTHRSPPPPCDQVQWSLFGVTLAGYNFLASLVLGAFSGFVTTGKGSSPRSIP